MDLRCPHRSQPLPGGQAGGRAGQSDRLLLRRKARSRPGLGRGPVHLQPPGRLHRDPGDHSGLHRHARARTSSIVALPLTGPDAGVLDISSIPTTGATSTLAAQIIVNAPTNDPWANGLQPYAELTFTGDSPQVCFQTTRREGVPERLDQRPGARRHRRHAGRLEPDHLPDPTRRRRVHPHPDQDRRPRLVPAGSPIGFTITLSNPGTERTAGSDPDRSAAGRVGSELVDRQPARTGHLHHHRRATRPDARLRHLHPRRGSKPNRARDQSDRTGRVHGGGQHRDRHLTDHRRRDRRGRGDGAMPDRGDHDTEQGRSDGRHADPRHRGRHRRQPGPDRNGDALRCTGPGTTRVPPTWSAVPDSTMCR